MSLLSLSKKLLTKHASIKLDDKPVAKEIDHLYHEVGKYIARHEATWHNEPGVREDLMKIYHALGEVVAFFEV
jgi:hypothetical protein